jgi:hypothetical protein
MSPKKKKASKDKRDRRVKKEKNLKDPPKEKTNLKDPPPGDLFDASFKANWTDKANWPLPASSNPLENILRPATRSDTSRLSQLQRESGRTVTSTPRPVDTTSCKSEIKSESSDSLTTGKEKDNKGRLQLWRIIWWTSYSFRRFEVHVEVHIIKRRRNPYSFLSTFSRGYTNKRFTY